jgi:hypothetical protein
VEAGALRVVQHQIVLSCERDDLVQDVVRDAPGKAYADNPI